MSDVVFAEAPKRVPVRIRDLAYRLNGICAASSCLVDAVLHCLLFCMSRAVALTQLRHKPASFPR